MTLGDQPACLVLPDLVELSVPDELDESLQAGHAGGSLLPMDTRSAVRVLRLTSHPRSTSPSTYSSGTKTSSMYTVLNIALPVSSRSGRTSTPSLSMSSRK